MCGRRHWRINGSGGGNAQGGVAERNREAVRVELTQLQQEREKVVTRAGKWAWRTGRDHGMASVKATGQRRANAVR